MIASKLYLMLNGVLDENLYELSLALGRVVMLGTQYTIDSVMQAREK